MKLILASNSPRRRELLVNGGFTFEIVPSAVDEGQPAADEIPAQYARRIARLKALDVAARSPSGSLVLGADTIVTIGGLILGKPSGPSDATRMMPILSFRSEGAGCGRPLAFGQPGVGCGYDRYDWWLDSGKAVRTL